MVTRIPPPVQCPQQPQMTIQTTMIRLAFCQAVHRIWRRLPTTKPARMQVMLRLLWETVEMQALRMAEMLAWVEMGMPAVWVAATIHHYQL